MKKLAQDRKFWHKLRENLDFSSNVKSTFSPKFNRLRKSIHKTDDKMRAKAKDIPLLLEEAKKNFNRREYVLSISYLIDFYKKNREIVYLIFLLRKKFGPGVENEILFKGVSQNKLKNVIDCPRCDGSGKYKNKENCYFCNGTGKAIKPNEKVSLEHYAIVKVGGVFDWFADFYHNQTNNRSKSIRLWEKSFPEQADKIKEGISSMISSAEDYMSFLLQSLDELSAARSESNFQSYFEICSEIRDTFWKDFNKDFKYNLNSSLKNKLESIESYLGGTSSSQQGGSSSSSQTPAPPTSTQAPAQTSAAPVSSQAPSVTTPAQVPVQTPAQGPSATNSTQAPSQALTPLSPPPAAPVVSNQIADPNQATNTGETPPDTSSNPAEVASTPNQTSNDTAPDPAQSTSAQSQTPDSNQKTTDPTADSAQPPADTSQAPDPNETSAKPVQDPTKDTAAPTTKKQPRRPGQRSHKKKSNMKYRMRILKKVAEIIG